MSLLYHSLFPITQQAFQNLLYLFLKRPAIKARMAETQNTDPISQRQNKVSKYKDST